MLDIVPTICSWLFTPWFGEEFLHPSVIVISEFCIRSTAGIDESIRAVLSTFKLSEIEWGFGNV